MVKLAVAKVSRECLLDTLMGSLFDLLGPLPLRQKDQGCTALCIFTIKLEMLEKALLEQGVRVMRDHGLSQMGEG